MSAQVNDNMADNNRELEVPKFDSSVGSQSEKTRPNAKAELAGTNINAPGFQQAKVRLVCLRESLSFMLNSVVVVRLFSDVF